MDNIIHLIFFPENSVPSFNIIMDNADNIPDGRYLPLINVNTTNHNIYRAIDRRPELYPGGVLVVGVVVALFTATATATPGFCCCCCCCCCALAFIYLASDVIIVMFRL